MSNHMTYDATKNIVHDSKRRRFVCTVVWLPLIQGLFIDLVRHVIAKQRFTKIDLIYIVEMPFLFLAATFYLYLLWFDGSRLPNTIDSLQPMESLISSRQAYDRRKRPVNYVITLIGLMYGAVFLAWIPSAYIFLFEPDLKMYAIQCLLGVPSIYYLFLIAAIMFLLADRTSLLNQTTEKCAREAIDTDDCSICNDGNSDPDKLCVDHQIEHVVVVYRLLTKICKEMLTYNNRLISPLIFVAIIQSPGVLIIVLSFIFRKDSDLDLGQIVITLSLTITVFVASCIYAQSFQLLSDQASSFIKTTRNRRWPSSMPSVDLTCSALDIARYRGSQSYPKPMPSRRE